MAIEPEIIRASILGDLDTLEDLIEEDGVNVETKSSEGLTPLACAVIHNQADVVTYLLDNDADKECRVPCYDIERMTPFAIAVHLGNVPMMKLLLSRGVLTNVIVGNDTIDEDELADHEDDGELFELTEIVTSKSAAEAVLIAVNELTELAKNGRNQNNDNLSLYRQMHDCIQRGASVHQYYEENDDSNQLSLLHLAVDNNNIDAVKALALLSADPNALDGNEATPLMLAAKEGRVGIARELLKMKSNLETKDRNGDTVPITDADEMTCLMHGMKHIEIAKLLIGKRHVSINECNKFSVVPLMHAALTGNITFIKYVFAHSPEKPNLSVIDYKGRTILMYAIMRKNSDREVNALVKYLIQNGLNIETIDDNNKTALNYARKRHRNDVVAFLQVNQDLLNLARGKPVRKTLAQLLADGASTNVRGDEGEIFGVQPLHLAAIHGDIKLLRELLDANADLNGVDDLGHKAADHALLRGHYDCLAQCLLYPLKQDKQGKQHKQMDLVGQDNKLSLDSLDCIKRAFDFVEGLSNPKAKASLLYQLGLVFKDELGMNHYARDAFNKITSLTSSNNEFDTHGNAELNLAEMSLVNSDKDMSELSLDVEDESVELSKRNVDTAMLHLIRSRFKPGLPFCPRFDAQLTKNFYDLSLQDNQPANLTTPEGVLQLAKDHRKLRRKSVDLSAENEKLRKSLGNKVV